MDFVHPQLAGLRVDLNPAGKNVHFKVVKKGTLQGGICPVGRGQPGNSEIDSKGTMSTLAEKP